MGVEKVPLYQKQSIKCVITVLEDYHLKVSDVKTVGISFILTEESGMRKLSARCKMSAAFIDNSSKMDLHASFSRIFGPILLLFKEIMTWRITNAHES